MIVIMHICSDGKIAGGATTTLLRLIKYSDKSKFKHIVVIPFDNPRSREFTYIDVDVELMKYSRDKSISARAFIEIIGYIRKYKPHIIHTHGAFYGRLAGKICGVQSLLYTRHTYNDKKYSLFSKLLNRNVTDKAVSVSDVLTGQIVSSGIPENKIINIENGCEEPNIDRAKGRDKFRLLLLGRLVEEKGIFTALEAVRILHVECDKYSLCIVGDGNIRPRIEKFIEFNHMSKYVTVMPFQCDITPFLSECGIMLNCSYKNEATSNSIIEGLSASMPIIASDVSGNNFVVSNGRDGIIYDAADALSLSNAVSVVLNDYDTYSDHARKTYLDRFTVSSMTDKYEKLWKDEYERITK